MTIGTNIKKIRESKKISQVELAHLIDVSQSVISSWESEETTPKSQLIPRLADVLGVDINELYKGESTINIVNNHDNKDNSVNGFEIHATDRNLLEELVSTLKDISKYIRSKS